MTRQWTSDAKKIDEWLQAQAVEDETAPLSSSFGLLAEVEARVAALNETVAQLTHAVTFVSDQNAEAEESHLAEPRAQARSPLSARLQDVSWGIGQAVDTLANIIRRLDLP